MFLKGALLLCAALMAQCATYSSYYEVHPSFQQCSSYCVSQFKEEDPNCAACCSGCRFLAITGVSSSNGEVSTERSKTACYNDCDLSYDKTTNACHMGCDKEYEDAETELTKLAQSNLDVGNMLSQMFNMFDSNLQPFFVNEQDKAQEVEKDVSDENLFNTLMGILPVKFSDDMPIAQDEPVIEIEPVESNVYGSGTGGYAYNLRDMNNGEDQDGTELDVARTDYLRRMLKARNTAHVLLVSSITACLFAVLWMVCSSSNDPVRKVTPTKLSSSPPAYETLYDEKKQPILFVTGYSDEAPPLPIKVMPADLIKSDI